MRSMYRFVGMLLGLVAMAASCGCHLQSQAQIDDKESSLAAESTASRLLQEGVDYLRADQIELAVRRLRSAASLEPESGVVLNNYGVALLRQQRFQEASEAFGRACRLLPEHAAPLNNLGLAMEAIGEIEQSVALYEKAVAVDPSASDAVENLARALVRKGDHSPELNALLTEIARSSERSEWRRWAERMLMQCD